MKDKCDNCRFVGKHGAVKICRLRCDVISAAAAYKSNEECKYKITNDGIGKKLEDGNGNNN